MRDPCNEVLLTATSGREVLKLSQNKNTTSFVNYIYAEIAQNTIYSLTNIRWNIQYKYNS